MGYVFDRRSAEGLEAWYQTATGRETLRLQRDLILRLSAPRLGERLLDVGCGSGLHLQAFQREGLFVAGLDPSPTMLELARARLGRGAQLHRGRAEDLPFEDNEFDIVTLITSLEFMDDPGRALAEAARVARRQVVIGALNRLSLTALGRLVEGWIRPGIFRRARLFSLWELIALSRAHVGTARPRWGSVGLLPMELARRAAAFEARPLVQRSPFGALLVVAADVTYNRRTDDLRIEVKRKIVPRVGLGLARAPHRVS